ncbi:uncharacterized protein BDR25DRAFT_5450 [Lindgomyces ingoldianus]|uniref:Uncharacterized protein n=1 Tax=Lindgomyces ingoldianus TaxID=673940 RepID=A0ACB6RF98_9PLEO|nr:uncharacterized protein BDR25DRAFT_5450 [Lindgomyces ingoldianus]KAF2477914.1 hypothetical protein BDR25DRAFT_5450 [Lindgomyces ingoldianus]
MAPSPAGTYSANVPPSCAIKANSGSSMAFADWPCPPTSIPPHDCTYVAGLPAPQSGVAGTPQETAVCEGHPRYRHGGHSLRFERRFDEGRRRAAVRMMAGLKRQPIHPLLPHHKNHKHLASRPSFLYHLRVLPPPPQS